jgi:hypothetical protein
MTHPADDQLQDFADEALDVVERAKVDAHLAHCDACSDTLEAIVALKGEALALGADVTPPARGWDAIEDRISRAASADVTPLAPRSALALRSSLAPRRSSAPRAPFGAAQWIARAAGLVLAAGFGGALLLAAMRMWPGEALDEGDLSEQAAAGVPVPSAAALVAEAYGPSIAELEEALAAGQASLDPETLRVVQENLQIIEEAIARARAAIESDPGRHGPVRSLDSLYAAMVQLLLRAAALVASPI